MTRYSVTVHNQSDLAWKFFIYQQPPELTNNLTLAWLVSYLEVRPEQMFTFNWTNDYSFVWSETGVLQPGVTFKASGLKPCDLTGNNFTTFSYDGKSAWFSDPVNKGNEGSLIIKDMEEIPGKVFSIGIGMSGKGAYVVNAQPDIAVTFTPDPEYYVVAADSDILEGRVIDISSIGTAMSEAGLLKFPDYVTSLTAIFTKENSWNIYPNYCIEKVIPDTPNVVSPELF